MEGIKQRKRKRKLQESLVDERSQKSKNLSKRWSTIDVDENIFTDGAVQGFMGLEEINDYDENELKNLTQPQNKKKRKRKMDGSDEEDNIKDSTEETKTELKPSEPQPKKITKKQRRKEKRKESFKLLLKERRKKRKALKKQEREIKLTETEKGKIVEKIERNSDGDSDEYSVDMSHWNGLGVPKEILKALAEKNFTSPTPIQKETLPPAMLHRKDIIGAAETGSGKTLAFAIPVVKHIMELKERRLANLKAAKQNSLSDEQKDGEDDDSPLYALILTPTRELAIQIHAHITDITRHTSIKSTVVVGGLAAPKQERLLSRSPEIVIGTPGRLHKLISNGGVHLNKFGTLRFFVIDECDRMLDHGHFKELNDIVSMVNNSNSKKQMFLFSATLTVPQNHKQNYKKQKQETNESQLQNLIDKIGVSSKVKVVDLTTKHVTASMLQQLRVMCTNEEKEMYLMYFLMTHPGRTIVFVNSIALTKKLSSLLTLLDREPLQLHAGKQQRQRLKYLDRFINNDNGLLIATDVAARGLDIPKVKHVVHFQLPVDPKVYVHRSGRTARAKENGLSFLLQGTEDFNSYKKILQVLKLDANIPSMDVDRGYLDGVKVRVVLAKEIDKEEYKAKKETSDSNWMDRTAKSMDMELDDDRQSAERSGLNKQQQQIINHKKKELKKLMDTKLIPKGFSGAFPTRGGTLASLGTLV